MAVAESKVGGIISALNGLEDDLDSLNSTVSDMKRQMAISAQKELDALREKVLEKATAQAEGIIGHAKEKATAQAQQIAQEAEANLEKVRADIEAGFEDAVKVVVSTVMEP